MSKPKKEDIDITHDILYTSQSYNLRTPFIITNHSQHTYVFKVKTNQKQAIHMPKTHGFVAPQSASTLPLKIINKPNEKFDLKLQVSYGIASEEQIKSNVSQMLNFDPSKLLKHVITLRKLNLTANNQSAQYQQPSKIMPKQPKIHFSRQENPLNQQLEQFLLDYQKNNKKKLNVIASVPSLVKKRKNSSQSEQKFVINPLPIKRSQKSQDKIAMNGLQVQKKNGKEQSFVSPMISEASQKNFPLKCIQLKNSHKFVQMPEYQKPLQERESLENETSKEESMLNLSKDRQIIQDLCKAEAERQKEIEEQKFKATEVETAQKMQQENQIQKQKEKELEIQLQKAIQIQLDSDTPEQPDCSINKLLSQPNNTVNLQKPDEIIDEQRLFNIFQRKQRRRTQNAQNLEQNSSVVKDVENENENENDKTIRMQGSHEGQNILSPRQKPQTLVKTSRNRQISAENQISITENMNKTEKDRRKKSQILVQDKDEQNKQTVINGEIKQNDYSGCFFKDAKTENHNQAENQGRKYLQESTIIKFHQEQSNKVDLVDEVLKKRFLQTMVSQQSPFLYSFKYENGRNNKNVPDSRLQESVIICKYGNGQQIEILESEKMEDEKDKDINDLLINFMNHQTNHQMNLQEPKKQYCAINPFQSFNPSSLQDKILSKSSYLPKPQVPNMNHMKISEKNQAQKRANQIKGIAPPLIIKRSFSSLDVKSQSNIKLHQLKSKEKIEEKIMEEIAIIQIKMECQEKFIVEINQVQEEYVKSLPRKYSWKLFLMGMILGLILGGLTKILLFPPKIKMSPKNNQALTSLTL